MSELILLARAGHGIWIHGFEITIEKLTDVLVLSDGVLRARRFQA